MDGVRICRELVDALEVMCSSQMPPDQSPHKPLAKINVSKFLTTTECSVGNVDNSAG